MANIKQIKLPSGTTYDIVDQGARDLIAELSNYTAYLGVTTTALTDGAITNPIVINGENVTAKAGNIATYQQGEFIFNGTAWQEFGDLSALGTLAYKNSASSSYTPAGTVTKPTFTGSAATLSMDYTPAGTVTKPAFTGTSATISMDYTPAGTVTQPTFSGTQGNITAAFTPAGSITMATENGTANYTPSGSITVNAPTVVLSTTSVTPMTGAGSLPSATMPNLTTTVANEVLTIGWTAGSFDAGSLPTMGSAVTVATGVSSVTSGGGSFSGNGVRLKATFAGTSGTATGTFTPAGTVTQPTFSGASATLSTSYTPAGNVTQPTFSGTSATLSTSYTPKGDVSQPTFSGTAATIQVS